MHKLKLLMAALILPSCALLSANLGSWKPMPYEAKPLTDEPGPAFTRLVMTARSTRPTKVDVSPRFVVMTYVGSGPYGTVQTVTLPFDEISRVDLLENKAGDFDVDVRDREGTRLYRYLSGDEAKAKEFVDVLVAYTRPAVLEPVGSPAFKEN